MERIRKYIDDSTFRFLAGFLLSAAAGFWLSGTDMAGVASFADISLAGGLGLPNAAAVLTGSLVHCILKRSIGRNIVKIGAMLFIVIAKMFSEPKRDPKFSGIITGLAVFTSGAAVSALIGEVLYKLIFYVFYGILSGASAASLAMIFSGVRHRRSIDLTGISGCAYAVSYTLITAALCTVKMPVLNPGIVFGAAVTLAAAYFYRHTGGVLCGALTTCSAFLADTEAGMTIVLLPAAGLITGYFYQRKINAAAGLFIGLNFMLMVLTGVTINSVENMMNILCGTGLFLVFAPYYSDKWVIVSEENTAALPDIINSRMSFLSDSIGAVRKESEKIAELLTVKKSDHDMVGRCSEEVCKKCYKRLTCWKTERDDTETGFRKMAELSEFSKENFPYELHDCLKKDELCRSFEQCVKERTAVKLLEMRYSESRKLLAEHMKMTEEIVDSAGERLDVRYSAPVSKVIREKLVKFGYSPVNVIAYYNSKNRFLAEIYFKASALPDKCGRICDLISDELRLPLDISGPVYSGREMRIRVFEKPEYSLQVYGAAVCAGGSKENGDTSLVFNDGMGSAYVVLSDGMGSGHDAAVESRLVVRMFKRLVSSGVEHNSAIKLINSIMFTKSGEETFATLDAVSVDLDTCELTLIKSGAAATIIRHRGNVMKIAQPTFPIGIYEESEAYSRRCDFEEGDMIIMFSDGICEHEYRFIKELLMSDSDLKRIVDEICRKAEVFNPNVRSDDVTVIGIKAVRTNPTR